MAILITPDGTVTSITPANRRKFTLEELQRYVGGSIELTPWVDTRTTRFIVNESGAVSNPPLPPNAEATARMHRIMADKLGIHVSDLPREIGRRLRYLPQLRGPVVLLEKGDKM